MKKAVKVTGIIWTILLIIAAVVCIIVGIVCFTSPQMLKEVLVSSSDAAKLTEAELAAVMAAVGGIYLWLGVWSLVGAILSIVMVAKVNSSMGKGGAIALGVLGIVFFAELPGIFFIVDAAKSR